MVTREDILKVVNEAAFHFWLKEQGLDNDNTVNRSLYTLHEKYIKFAIDLTLETVFRIKDADLEDKQ